MEHHLNIYNNNINMDFCKNCKAIIKPDFRFCPNCGKDTKEPTSMLSNLLKSQINKGKINCWHCESIVPVKNIREAEEILNRFGNIYCVKCGQPQNIDNLEKNIRKTLLKKASG